jgi:hypothetical protein
VKLENKEIFYFLPFIHFESQKNENKNKKVLFGDVLKAF